MNQVTLIKALRILTNSGIVTLRDTKQPPPMPIKQGERLHKYHGVVIKVASLFGEKILVGDVVTHLAFGDYCKLNKAEILTPPSFYSEASPGEQSDLA